MIKIEVRSHGLVVRCETDYERQTVLKVVQANQDQMDVMARIRNPKAPPVLKDRYALVGRYFFVMNRQLQQPLINRIEYTRQQYELTECPPTETPDIDFQWEKKFELREDQLPVADFLKDAKDTHSLMIESPPGS